MSPTLDPQIHRLAFWSAVILLVAIVVSFALPLDVPGGADASHQDRVDWLLANRGTFILAWINQIVAMATLTGTFAGFARILRKRSPLAALLASLVLLTSFIAFIIPKFMAVWTIPLLAQAATGGGPNQEMADAMLTLLNVSAPYSLFTSFDYLGFWLYAVFGLLVARPLFGGDLWSKAAALSFGVYGVAYHVVVAAILLGSVPAHAIETYALSLSMLLVLPPLLALALFRRAPEIPAQPQMSTV